MKLPIAAEIITAVAQPILEKLIEEGYKEKKDARRIRKLENEMFDSIERIIKEELEKDAVKDWIMKEQYTLDKGIVLFEDSDKKEFVKCFFDNVPEIKYVHSDNVEKILVEYINKLNEVTNQILSTESKIIIDIITKESGKQSERIAQDIADSTKEIKKYIKDFTDKIENKETKSEICKLRRCIGYGVKRGICSNVVEDGLDYCKDCLDLEYQEKVINIYKIQKYNILNKEKFFIAEQKAGIVKIQILVLPFRLDDDIASDLEIQQLTKTITNATEFAEVKYIHIVTNGTINIEQRKLLQIYNVEVFTEENIINESMDFRYYLGTVVNEYTKNELYKHYIDIYDEKTDAPLILSVTDFMSCNSENALLVLGDYGCGKTSFLFNLSYELAKSYLEGESQYIPLYIPLKDFSKAINFDGLFMNLFAERCQIINPSIEMFKLLLKYKKFIILFDGFDEVAKRVNYDVKFEIFNEICKYGIGDTKIIVTCRPNYFQEKREYEKLMELAHLHIDPYDKNTLSFEETYIRKLDESQIIQYIASFKDDLKKQGLTTDDINHFIKETHDLTDLAKRPFLLNIIIRTLPELIKEINGEKQTSKINAASLYKKYVEIWLDRETSKGKTLIRQEDKLHFCKHIAYKMFSADKYELHFKEFPKEIKEYFTELTRIDEIDYFSHDIQSCSFMNADGRGNFKFIHESFMEFFVASVIIEELIKETEIDEELINNVLKIREIPTEVALFINDMLDENTSLKENLFKSLEKCIDKIEPKARENAITILSKAKYNTADIIENGKSYIKSDFSHSTIKDKIIKNVDFSNASFYGSIIENVKFVNCKFEQTYFQKASLINVDFSKQSLEYANMSYCHIQNSRFVGSFLAEAQISQAIITNSVFKSCDMSGANTEGTVFKNNYCDDVVGMPYIMK